MGTNISSKLKEQDPEGYYCDKKCTTINGKATYARLFLKAVGFQEYLGKDEEGNELWAIDIPENEEERNELLGFELKDKKTIGEMLQEWEENNIFK